MIVATGAGIVADVRVVALVGGWIAAWRALRYGISQADTGIVTGVGIVAFRLRTVATRCACRARRMGAMSDTCEALQTQENAAK